MGISPFRTIPFSCAYNVPTFSTAVKMVLYEVMKGNLFVLPRLWRRQSIYREFGIFAICFPFAEINAYYWNLSDNKMPHKEQARIYSD